MERETEGQMQVRIKSGEALFRISIITFQHNSCTHPYIFPALAWVYKLCCSSNQATTFATIHKELFPLPHNRATGGLRTVPVVTWTNGLSQGAIIPQHHSATPHSTRRSLVVALVSLGTSGPCTVKQYTAMKALLHFRPSMNFAILHKMYQMTASVIKSSAVNAQFTGVNKLVSYFPH
jgi:hypothetical protein